VDALGDVAPIPEARLGVDVQQCPFSRDEKERCNPCYCGPKSLTCRENSLETASPHSSVDNDTAKSCPCDTWEL